MRIYLFIIIILIILKYQICYVNTLLNIFCYLFKLNIDYIIIYHQNDNLSRYYKT